MAETGPPYSGILKYCTRCCLPETLEGVAFDEMGICTACRAQEEKMRIDWASREKTLRQLFEKYRDKTGQNYDCMVPISGGKDSTFQLHVLTRVYGLKPLAVTFNHNWYTETGLYNLYNALEKFDVDHIMFTPNRRLVNQLARKSLGAIGDACWHCHMGVGAFPLQVAVKFGVRLLVWGDSVSEGDGRGDYRAQVTQYDRDYFVKYSARFEPPAMADDQISLRDMSLFQLPSREEIERSGVVGIHLSNFIFWDEERQMEFVKKTYGWREDHVEGTYKGYKSVECVMAGVHDYAKFIKRGFGRGTDHASADVRAGLLTREEGFALAREEDSKRPAALDYYLKITGMTEREFIETLKAKREGKALDLPSDYPAREAPRPAQTELEVKPAIVKFLEGKAKEETGGRPSA